MNGENKTAVEQASKLAEQLPTLNVGETRVDVLGTAHVSRVSRDQVTELLESGGYDAVAVELCKNRYEAIVYPNAVAQIDLGQAIRKRRLGAIIALLALHAYQQRLADHLGVELGAEMKEAVRCSQEHEIALALIDRDIGVTFKRIYRSVSWWRRMTLATELLLGLFSRQRITEVSVEEMKQSDMLSGLFRELQVLDPRFYETLLAERDLYMALKIINYAVDKKPRRMLVVVGAGHVEGLTGFLLGFLGGKVGDSSREIKRLDETPPAAKWVKFVPWAIVGLILTGFTAAFRQDIDLGVELVIAWILFNGGLSSLGALLAGAHPLTIVTAFLAAPLTSINPIIGAGMVAAAVELYLRKPTVVDFQNLRTDTARWVGWRSNRVARTALIFLFSGIGSAVGTYLGGFYIYGKL